MNDNEKLALTDALVLLQKTCFEHTIKKWNRDHSMEYNSCDAFCPLIQDHYGNCGLVSNPPREWTVNSIDVWYALFHGDNDE